MTKNWRTRLIHSDAKIPQGYRSLASPTFRGSTTLFPSSSVVTDTWDHNARLDSYQRVARVAATIEERNFAESQPAR